MLSRFVALSVSLILKASPSQLHAGTVNMSPLTRYFVSIYLTRSGLPHRDSFDNEQVHELCAKWRAAVSSHGCDRSASGKC